MTINVLGTEYKIIESDKAKDINLEEASGYCDFTTHEIVIDTFQSSPGSYKDLEVFRKNVIRHEIVHAFLYESGLDASSWGRNEEIVDWIALQSDKLFKAFEEVKAK